MNLTLTILSGGQPNRHVFGPEGGRFGRSQKCEWVLADPDLILSSVHGRIHLVNGAFLLIDESTNGIFIGSSSEPIGKGNSIVCADGLRFRAGIYQIEMRLVQDQGAYAAGAQPTGYQPQPGYALPQQAPIYAQQQPAYAPSQMAMPQAVLHQSRAEDALRQRSEYGDLWSSNSQDPLAYLDGDAGAPQNGSAYLNGGSPQIQSRSAGAIPAGFYPEFPQAGPSTGLLPLNLPPAYQPPVQQQPVPFATDVSSFPQHQTPYDSLPGAQLREFVPEGNSAGQPWPEVGHGGNGQGNGHVNGLQQNGHYPTQRGGIPDDFFSKLTPAVPPPANPMPVPLPVLPQLVTQAAIPPAVPSVIPLAAPGAMPRRTIPDNFDPFASFGFGGAKTAATDALPISVPQPRAEFPPFASPPTGLPVTAQPRVEMPSAMPIIPPLPDMVMPPAAEKPRSVEQLSPSLLADVIKIEPPAVMPEKRAVVAEKPGFDPLEALRSRREERTAALERKARGQANGYDGALPAAIPAGLPTGVATSVQGQPIDFPAQPQAAASQTAGTGRKDAVVAALFRGMGFPASAALPAESEQVAESVGLMVRAISEGLVQLLSARQMLKSEFRMDETQMRPEENNPFKYYKIAELALDELFVTRSGGFQDPAEAAATAFADIQQYVMLTTSAIQRAMTLMFQRLSPEAIARDAEGDGGMRIRGLGGGKGKWETYVDNHARMSGRLDGITRQIISEAFAQVQEEQARKNAAEHWEKKK